MRGGRGLKRGGLEGRREGRQKGEGVFICGGGGGGGPSFLDHIQFRSLLHARVVL